jgi:hypothetical protein
LEHDIRNKSVEGHAFDPKKNRREVAERQSAQKKGRHELSDHQLVKESRQLENAKPLVLEETIRLEGKDCMPVDMKKSMRNGGTAGHKREGAARIFRTSAFGRKEAT